MEEQIRLAAFAWLKQQAILQGPTLSRALLTHGFPFQGQLVTLQGPSGIWKPRQFESTPISITTIFNSSYEDKLQTDDFLLYRFREGDPHHRDNLSLLRAKEARSPLIYFLGVTEGYYLPVWPIFIFDVDFQNRYCRAAIDPAYALQNQSVDSIESPSFDAIDFSPSVRKYVMTYTKHRLHQGAFRERVISAYGQRCALCTLRHRELLDAAHIIPDNEERGVPIVSNGLSLCKIHHAAYDQDILTITPEYQIKTRKDVLAEADGPMLRYGLQELNNQKLYLPHRKDQWPDRDRLEIRYKRFLEAG